MDTLAVDFRLPCLPACDAFAAARAQYADGGYLGAIDVAAIPTDADFDALRREVGKGTAPRDARRALRLGYSCRVIDPHDHEDELYAINTSKEMRSGRPMDPAYRERWHLSPATKHCDLHYREATGIFSPDGTLVGYVSLQFTGDIVCYARILGHGDHLSAGIMYALHAFTFAHTRDTSAARVVMYGTWNPSAEGLTLWKRKNGFRPYRLTERQTA